MPELKIFINTECYYPGNIVEGAVELTVGSSGMGFNNIRLTFTGKERVRHMTTRKVNGKAVDFEDSERNLFFKDVVILGGDLADDKALQSIKEGVYRYPFAFKLPLDIPPSISECFDKKDFAEILYQVKACVIKPNVALTSEEIKKRESENKNKIVVDKPIRVLKTQRYFHVLRPMPATQYADQKSIITETPFHLQKCGCCEAGNQIQYLDVERTVVAMDRDNLQVVINVDNSAALKPVSGLKLKLRRTFAYRCNDFTKRIVDVPITKQTNLKVIPNGSKGVLGGICPVPLNLCPTFKTFNMECSYSLLIVVKMDGCADQESVYPVTIVQSVDDTNSIPRLIVDENPYVNFFGRYAPALAYTPPTSQYLSLQPIPSGLPEGGDPSTACCATQFGPIGLPSNFWQVKQEKKDQRKRHVNGEPVKYEATPNASAGLGQPFVDECQKPLEVKYPASRMRGGPGFMSPTLPSLPSAASQPAPPSHTNASPAGGAHGSPYQQGEPTSY